MAIYECRICLYRYNEDTEGVLFNDLPDSWVCPDCKAPKKYFRKIEK